MTKIAENEQVDKMLEELPKIVKDLDKLAAWVADYVDLRDIIGVDAQGERFVQILQEAGYKTGGSVGLDSSAYTDVYVFMHWAVGQVMYPMCNPNVADRFFRVEYPRVAAEYKKAQEQRISLASKVSEDEMRSEVTLE